MIQSYNSYQQSNDSSSTKFIPEGLTGKARFTLCPQDDGNQRLLWQTVYGLVYLQGVFTLVNGHYAGHRIEQIIAVAMNEHAAHCSHAQRQTMDTWMTSGRLFIQKLLSSAQRFDLEDSYKQHLSHNTPFDYQYLDGLYCVIMVGEGLYPPHRIMNKSQVAHIFVPPHHFYIEAMEQNQEIYAYPYSRSRRQYETPSLFRDDVLISTPHYIPIGDADDFE